MTGLLHLAGSCGALLADAANPSSTAMWDGVLTWAKNPHPLTWGIALGGLALWLMLPRGRGRGRIFGALLGLAALGCLGSRLLPVGQWNDNAVFWTLCAVTIISATCTITFRSPVYCAVWFAMTLTGTAGIFMVQGAQFLAVATIVVYAGAILVTFLFVLMLAQPRGDAFYDRVSWEALLAAATGAILVGVLSSTVGKLHLNEVAGPTTESLQTDVLTNDHVARLGAELFGRHLVAVEVAGTLLLVALVGATAIVSAQRGPAAQKTIRGPNRHAADGQHDSFSPQEAAR